jgi:hypothetical protein
MFLFKMQSLTEVIDYEIHRAVRRSSPRKYRSFIWAGRAARILYAVAFNAILVYLLTSVVLGRFTTIEAEHLAKISEYFATTGFFCLAFAVVSHISHEVFYRDLEPIARSELSQVAKTLSERL